MLLWFDCQSREGLAKSFPEFRAQRRVFPVERSDFAAAAVDVRIPWGLHKQSRSLGCHSASAVAHMGCTVRHTGSVVPGVIAAEGAFDRMPDRRRCCLVAEGVAADVRHAAADKEGVAALAGSAAEGFCCQFRWEVEL